MFSYELANAETPMTPDGRLTVRFIVYDEVDGKRAIATSRRQDLFLFDPALLEGDTPILEFIRGWGESASRSLHAWKDRALRDLHAARLWSGRRRDASPREDGRGLSRRDPREEPPRQVLR